MLNRRELLARMAGGALGAATLSFVPAGAVLAEIRREAKPHLAMLIDLRRCNGCRACVVSCGHENGNLPDQHRTSVFQAAAEVDGKELVLNLPLMCNHCDLPVCTMNCPTKATFKRKEDGIVVIDSTKCIACGQCIKDCPYAAVRFFNRVTKKVDKCNFCIHRLAAGLRPACVDTCTGAARVFGDINDPESEISRRMKGEDVLVLEAAVNTKPNVFYIGLTPEQAKQRYSLIFKPNWQH